MVSIEGPTAIYSFKRQIKPAAIGSKQKSPHQKPFLAVADHLLPMMVLSAKLGSNFFLPQVLAQRLNSHAKPLTAS